MITPKNVASVLKDKQALAVWDLSAGLTSFAVPFIDPNNDYDVVSVDGAVTTALSGTATTINIGEAAGPSGATDSDKFVDAQQTPAAATAAGEIFSLELSDTDPPQRVLRAGHQLTVSSAGSADTGVATLIVTLRPKQKARGHVSKRPGGSAQSPS